ncbi:MAG: hypothetical protein R2766_11810 [Saprospiraceae bacterium]
MMNSSYKFIGWSATLLLMFSYALNGYSQYVLTINELRSKSLVIIQ